MAWFEVFPTRKRESKALRFQEQEKKGLSQLKENITLSIVFIILSMQVKLLSFADILLTNK